MKITVRQTGGFIGFLQHQLDSATLPDDQRSEFDALLLAGRQEARMLERKDVADNSPSIEIEIANGDQETLRVDQPGDTIRQLISFVRKNGKPVSL